MARGGAKPKPAALRLIEGTVKPNEVRSVGKSAAHARAVFGPVKCPRSLGPAEQKAWDDYIAPAHWLDRSREPIAIMFCGLWAQYQADPTGFHVTKHREMRACMAELGLTDERNRIGSSTEDEDSEGLFS